MVWIDLYFTGGLSFWIDPYLFIGRAEGPLLGRPRNCNLSRKCRKSQVPSLFYRWLLSVDVQFLMRIYRSSQHLTEDLGMQHELKGTSRPQLPAPGIFALVARRGLLVFKQAFPKIRGPFWKSL